MIISTKIIVKGFGVKEITALYLIASRRRAYYANDTFCLHFVPLKNVENRKIVEAGLDEWWVEILKEEKSFENHTKI